MVALEFMNCSDEADGLSDAAKELDNYICSQ